MNPRLERALLLLQQNRAELAEPELRQALALDPQDAFAHALLALCLNERKAFREATEAARQAIHLAPDFPYAHYAHAHVLSSRNRNPEALAAIAEAIRLDPEDADFFALQAGLLIDERRWPEALAAADRGLQFDAEHVGCNNLRAIALNKMGRRAEAGQTIDAALARNPENAVTHANQGWALLERGDRDRALEHFREALRLDPENEWARQGIIETLKARHLVYSLFLKYFFFMSRLSAGAQWGVIIGGYLGVRMLGAAADSHPALAPWVWPVRILYVLFVLLTWTADPLFNLALRLNRFGRLALTPDQTRASNWVGACVGLALLALAAAWLTDWNTRLTVATFLIAGLIIPLAGTFKCHAGWPRRAMGFYTGVLALCAAAAVALHAAGSLGETAGPFLLLYLLGVIGSPWIANVLIMRRPRH